MIEFLKSLMSGEGLDFESLLPDLSKLPEMIVSLLRWVVILGPLCLLGVGLWLLLAAPKEANHTAGYRFYWGMSSVEAWQFTQRLAGIVWGALGTVLTMVAAASVAGYAKMPMDDITLSALKTLSFQIVSALASCVVINFLVFARFDRKGIRRSEKYK